MVAIITCPYQHLVDQWERELIKFNIQFDESIKASSINNSWKDDISKCLIDISIGNINKAIIFTTHKTFSSKDFIKIMEDKSDDIPILLIADEVHGIGAEKSRNGLINRYNFKLGLSATPERWFDDLGTNVIYKYFGNVIFKFSLYIFVILIFFVRKM
jgi:superfamily II DNA or RNA helicase